MKPREVVVYMLFGTFPKCAVSSGNGLTKSQSTIFVVLELFSMIFLLCSTSAFDMGDV